LYLRENTDGVVVVNIVTDFLLALLPIPLIWKLQMPVHARIGLVGILSFGLVAAAVGIVRQVQSATVKLTEFYTYDWYTFWNFLELDLGIVAASLPALKPLFGSFFSQVKAMTGFTNTKISGKYHDSQGLSYQRQQDDHVSEEIVLGDWKSAEQSVAVTGWTRRQAIKSLGSVSQASGSEEKILPFQQSDRDILVTTKVQIGR